MSLQWTDYTASTPGAEIRDSINAFNTSVVMDVNQKAIDINKNREDIGEVEDRLALLEASEAIVDTDHDGESDLEERVAALEEPSDSPDEVFDPTELETRISNLEENKSNEDTDNDGVTDLAERVTALEQGGSIWTPTKSGNQDEASNRIVDTSSKSYFGGEPIAINLGRHDVVRRVTMDLDLVSNSGAQNSYTIKIVSSKLRPIIKIVDILEEEMFSLSDEHFIVAVDTMGNLVLNIVTPSGSLNLMIGNCSVTLSN